MAGIVGYVNSKTDKLVLDKMADTIKHRGPDYRLSYRDDKLNLAYNGLNIGHKDEGHELYEDEELVVLINGYLNNEEEIKEILENHGSNYKTKSSGAELLALLYKKEKRNLASLIKGSYLILIWEKEISKLTIIRDIFGVQPIFYYQTNDELIFASEAKALLEHPHFIKEFNKKALRPYLVFQAPSLKESFFKGVFKLDEASFLEYENKELKETRYWDLKFDTIDRPLEEIVEDIDKQVKYSLEEKTQLNQEIGSFLSGGVDSSYLASLYRPKKTYTVGFSDKDFSEIDNAKDLSDIIGSENINKFLDPKICFDKLNHMQYMLDEPSSNPSVVPLYFLSALAKESGNNVVLSGEGADEFFGGYFEYVTPKEIQKYNRLPKFLRRFNGAIAEKLPTGVKGRNFFTKGGLPVEKVFIGQAKIFNEHEAIELVKPAYKNSTSIREITGPIYDKVKKEDDLTKKQFLDFHLWMINDIMLKADRMSMANSLQIITPLLDQDLLDVARTIPSHYRVNDQKTKYAFRLAANKSLPDEWAKRKKLGFPVPIRLWIREKEFYEDIKKTFESDYAGEFFDQAEILRLLSEHYNNHKNNQRKIWTIYMFLLWYEEYFIKR